MKMTKTLLALGILVAMLTAMPSVSNATNTPKTVTVTPNSDSGIESAEWTATLDDGTILGFLRYYEYATFLGAVSTSSSLVIPDSIYDGSNRYAVQEIGISYYPNRCDFSNAQNLTSLTIPATVNSLYVPATIKTLHLKGYVENFISGDLLNLTKAFVPEDLLSTYYENNGWSKSVLIIAEGADPLKITINMTKPGEFAQLLLQIVDNWYRVNELAVVGEMNTDDLNVFKRMKQLTKLDLSKAVITEIPYNFSNANGYNGEDGLNILEEVILPEINSIEDYAFSHCSRLKSISMPKVNKIGYDAFSTCGATQIVLPEGITTIGESAFSYSALDSITIPSSITEISDYCFRDCANLKSVTIPQTITRIGCLAFHATALTKISLPGVQAISDQAFLDCTQLKKVKFADGLVSIGYDAFSNCTSLREIDLPSTLLSMNRSFAYCSNIKKVTSRATTPPTNNGFNAVIAECDMTDVKLYVPAMSIDVYRAEGGWKSFYTILPMEDKVTNAVIYDYATIDDASQFATGCDMTLTWNNDYGQNSYGALDYNDNSTISLGNYSQSHYLGGYYDGAIFTSLITNGSMRADNVKTTLKIDNPYMWYFISLPYDVKVSDISYPEGTHFAIRKYSGLNRAQMDGDTWVNLSADDVMNAYEGYILRCNKEYAEFIFPAINNTNKNNIFEKESVVMPLNEYLSEFEHNRSWNLIGNPYPCYYDTRRMDFTAPITVWNDYYHRYDAFSPIDDGFILYPAQAFFVQRPVDQASITFDKAGRQKNSTVQPLEARANTRASINTDRKIFNIVMSDGTTEDRTRFVLNSDASCDYELDKDASKFISDNHSAMLVYTVENGVRYAINERPVAKGIIGLGFYALVEGEYILSLNTKQTDKFILVDNELKTEKALTDEYRFHAVAGFNDTRFSVMLDGTTGISAVSQDGSPCSVYTLDGRQLGSYSAGRQPALSKGIYVISSKDVKRKIVVK